MIRKDISNSNGYASLSPEAAVLFAMMIPHLNSHGKMCGGAGYIKDEICPKIPYLTYEKIPELLAEINSKTNVKWFEENGRRYIHSINFLKNHQALNEERLGVDELPDYVEVKDNFPSTPELVRSKSMSTPKYPSTSTSTSTSTSNLNLKEITGRIFEHWKIVHNHPRAKIDDTRKSKVSKALNLGYSEADLIKAVDGCKKSPHHQGQNDKQEIYDDFELILRDAKHIDAFIKHADREPPPPKQHPTGLTPMKIGGSQLDKLKRI